MPRAPQFKTQSIRDLFRQLSYAPEETRLRLMERAEAFVEEVEPGRAYPEEFVSYRITNYRVESSESPVMLVGEALLADLATFVQGLSRTLALPPECEKRGTAVLVDELAESLNVAARTLRRYHKRGLLFHHVLFNGGESRLACYEQSLDRFRAKHPDLLVKAERFSRVDEEDVSQIIAEAIAMARDEGVSRQSAARRLARRHGRAVETIRAMIARHEERSRERIFTLRRRTPQRERRLIERAWRMGVEPQAIAAHLERGEQTIARLIAAYRLGRIASIDLSYAELPTFKLDDAETVILAPTAVNSGLESQTSRVDLFEWITALKAAPKVGDGEESARLSAYHFLKRRVKHAASSATRDANLAQMDRCERDLRWAALLKRTVVARAMPTAIVRFELNLARPLLHQPSEMIRDLIRLAILEMTNVAESVDVAQGQTVSRLGAQAIDRRCARLGLTADISRAGARHAPGEATIEDPFGSLCPWQRFLELRLSLLERLEDRSGSAYEIVRAHYGLGGERPRLVSEIAADFSTSERAVRAQLREAINEIRRA